jgi:hypothetical protein
MRKRMGHLAALAVVAGLAGACAIAPPTLPGVIAPAYVFPVGASQNDVLAMLGTPAKGPIFDRYSGLTELVYSFPFPAIRTETRFPDGTVRVETVDRIHMFFDRKNRLERMSHRTNRYYPSITELPVQRITVLPRRIDPDGRMHPVTAAHGSPAAK